MTARACFRAARVWWLFRLMGKTDIAVLDGGFPKWQAEGARVEDMPPMMRDRHITVSVQNHLVRDVTQVAALETGRSRDSRCPRRRPVSWRRTRTARRAARRSHPGIKNVPLDTLLNADGTMKAPEETRAIFEAAGVDLDKPIITSCGSGVTAAVHGPRARTHGPRQLVAL